MLKQTHKAGSSRSSHILLYDRVRDDIFENQQQQQHHHRTVVIPSITTIALLQLQAYTIQLLTLIPQQRQQRQSSGILASILRRYSPLNVIRQTLRWILLIGLLLLDNVARILNVESEMNRMVTDIGEDDNKSTACDTFIDDQEERTSLIKQEEEHNPKTEEHEEAIERPLSLHINVGNTHDFHVAGELLKKPSYRDIHDQCRSSEPSTPTTTTIKRCLRPCCETPRNTSNNNNSKSGLVIDSRPFVSPSSPNSPTPSFIQQRASHTPRTRKISSPSAMMTTSTSTSTSSHHQPHHILKVSADSSPVLGPLLRPGTRHARSLSNNIILSQVQKAITENKASTQQNQTLRRIGAQREITVPNNNNNSSNNNNVPPPRQKRSLVPNILKKKKSPAPSNATTTSSSSESSTTKEHPEYSRSPKLQKSLSTATEHHHHDHHHHDHHKDHQYNVKTMGEFLQENPLIRKDVY
ncbi:hypothetical protein K501DRAFT_284652 [Backusella circina FSU 941]|nr:hypothetical protein K501DRAFT_284652 [Backusella circina FSU 941]